MRKRLVILFIVAACCLAIPTVSASLESDRSKGRRFIKPELAHKGGAIKAGSYRSPSRVHKVLVRADSKAAREASGAAVMADYGSFRLLAMDEAGLLAQETSAGSANPGDGWDQVTVRDDLNVLLLRSGAIDTTANEAPGRFYGIGPGASYSLQSVGLPDGAAQSELRLIQLVGPVKRAWLDEMNASGVELIAYVPNNGYLIRADSGSFGRLMERNLAAAGRGEEFIQWDGPFLAAHKIHPKVAAMVAEQPGELTVAVQLALGARVSIARDNPEVARVRRLASAVLVDAYDILNFTNLRLKVRSSLINELAALPSVVNIEPWDPPQLFDERASQVVAGELNSEGTAPTGPGYFAWLAAHGFSSNFDFAIDVSDTGIDRGFTDPAMLHPDFLDSSQQSRVAYARDYTSELDPGDVPGHGTLNLSIAGGANTSASSRDSSGFGFGLGIAPFARLGSSKIFQSNSRFDLVDPFTRLVADAYRDGARVSSNSWGSVSNAYSIDSQEYDLRVRDAAPGQPGNQELTICFAAGNAGFDRSIGSPSTAKNVISVAASESSRKDGLDGCFVRDDDSDSAMDMAYFSSGGPLDDGRIKPDITAPGTHIVGAASQNPDFDGSGVCGKSSTSPYFPEGQTLYTWSSGTSHSTPQVAGAAALVRQFLLNHGETPNAALIKALLLNTTTYMTGVDAGGNLPHPHQGWGLMDMGRAFNNTPKFFVNQTTVFSDSGQSLAITGEVKDPTQPFRVTLAWTDAPGFSAAAPWVNDLDLEVAINGQVYRGNNFVGQESQPGGDPDTKNNVEAVWLPAGTVGTFLVRVRAANIAGDGIPGNSDLDDQDFALVVYNGERKDAGVASIANVALAGGADSVADPGEAVSMKLSIMDLSPIAISSPHGTITTTTAGVTITGGGADFPTVAPGQTAEGASAFAFTIGGTVPCGSTINFVLDVTSQGLLSRIPFTIQVGKADPAEFFSDDVESGEAKWTHGSGIKKKKKRVDTWTMSTKRVHSGTSSWFTKDPGDKIIDAHLDSVPIQLPAQGRSLQLVFYHTFEFEPGGFDGGVLEISTGADFEDLGPKILKGGYNGDIFEFFDNPLAGRLAWVDGRLGVFRQVVVDLSSYAGKTVTIRFRIGTDSDVKGLGWYIDDVSVRGERVSCTSVSLAGGR